MKLPTKLY